MNFLELFNAVAEVARPVYTKYHPVENKTDKISSYGLDSLDNLMICVFLCELYGIPEEVGKEMQSETVQQIDKAGFDPSMSTNDYLTNLYGDLGIF